MMPNSKGERQLNPFAFPAETNVRFVLLIIAALAFSFTFSYSAYGSITYILTGDLTNPFSELEGVVDYLHSAGNGSREADIPGLIACVQTVLSFLLIPFGYSAATIGLAYIIYRMHPARVRRKKMSKTLLRERDPKYYREIDILNHQAGIMPPPTIESGGGLRSQHAQAFGVKNHYVLFLGEGLRLLWRKLPGAFRAIFLHELAHIGNQDVERTYFTQAIWIATLFVCVMPYVLVVLANSFYDLILTLTVAGYEGRAAFTLRYPGVLITFVQMGVSFAVLMLIRASILRNRETYADWRAAIWGEKKNLSDMLSTGGAPEKSSKFSRLFRLHPSRTERLNTLRNPARLFAMSLDIPIFVGFLLASLTQAYTFLQVIPSLFLLTFTILVEMSLSFLRQIQAIAEGFMLVLMKVISTFVMLIYRIIATVPVFTLINYVIPFFLISLTVSWTLGVQIHRQSVADLHSGRTGIKKYLHLFIPALFLVLGYELGMLVQPQGAFWPQNVKDVLLTIIIFTLFTGSSLLCLIYTRFFGQLILGTHRGKLPPKRMERLLALIVAFLLATFYFPLVQWRQFTIFDTRTDPQTMMLNLMFIPVSLLVALVIYPIIFSITWVGIKIKDFLIPPRCPFCQRIVLQKNIFGKQCTHCQRDLAPWLFI